MRRLIVGAAMVMAVALVLGSAGDAEAAKPRKKGAAASGGPFQKLDTNKDGKLSRDEFRNVFQVLGKGKGKGKGKGGQDSDALFTKLDTNNNNYLTPTEFAKLPSVLGQGKKKNK
jgi:hypothetical protein